MVFGGLETSRPTAESLIDHIALFLGQIQKRHR